jgi:hypothetical protein
MRQGQTDPRADDRRCNDALRAVDNHCKMSCHIDKTCHPTRYRLCVCKCCDGSDTFWEQALRVGAEKGGTWGLIEEAEGRGLEVQQPIQQR